MNNLYVNRQWNQLQDKVHFMPLWQKYVWGVALGMTICIAAGAEIGIKATAHNPEDVRVYENQLQSENTLLALQRITYIDSLQAIAVQSEMCSAYIETNDNDQENEDDDGQGDRIKNAESSDECQNVSPALIATAYADSDSYADMFNTVDATEGKLRIVSNNEQPFLDGLVGMIVGSGLGALATSVIKEFL